MLVLIGVVLVLSACSGSQQTKITDVNYYEGSQGLTVEFMDNMPPDKVYAGEEYPVALKIHNAGAFDLLPGLFINGERVDFSAQVNVVFDPLYFKQPEGDLFSALGEGLTFAGRSPQWPEGESDIVTLGFLQANTLEARLGADTKLMLGVCYPYETKLTTPVCVDVDPYNADDRFQSCQQQDLSFTDQGAPVAVTQVAVENMPAGSVQKTVDSQVPVYDDQGFQTGYKTVQKDELVLQVKPVFRLTIENVGDGQVVRGRLPSQPSLCTDSSPFSTSTVSVKARLGNTILECRPTSTGTNGQTFSEVKLYDGVGEAICSVPDDALLQMTANYQSVLQVEVTYVYQSQATKDIQVEDSIKQYEAPKASFRCADFHGNYALCKAYSEQGADPLDCFYCQATDECLSRSGCGTCPDPTPDDDSRLCITKCPEPSISIGPVDDAAGLVNVTCVDGAGITTANQDRCGCSSILYRFAENTDACADTTSYDLGASPRPDRNGAVRLTVDLTRASGQQDVLCALGSTPKGDDGKTTVSTYATKVFR